jgi:hypothetical protein
MTYQLRLLCGFALVFVLYVASNFATVLFVPTFIDVNCNLAFLVSECSFPSDTGDSMAGAAVLAASVIGFLTLARWKWREATAYPFLALFGWICLLAIAYDAVAGRPVINASKIINDTVNILAAVIAASFVLLLVIIRKENYSLLVLARAIATSFAVKVVSVTVFIAISELVFGATELFLLYVVYAFGAFTLHLMTVCGFIAKVAPSREEGTVACA